MDHSNQKRAMRLEVESMEGRALLSGGLGLAGLKIPAGLAAQFSIPRGIKTDPAGVAAIMSALRGGPGSEFAQLAQRNLGSIPRLVREFSSGARTEYVTNGMAFKLSKWNEAFTGPRYDHLAALAAGGLVLRNGQIELAMLTRGYFDENSDSQIVFGVDRGAGASLPLLFSSRPNLKADTVVTVNIGPYGQTVSGTVTDRVTGAVTELDPTQIKVVGATVRVYLNPSQLPSQGLATNRFRVGAWTQHGTAGGIENVGSFLPESSMFTVAVQPGARVRPRR